MPSIAPQTRNNSDSVEVVNDSTSEVEYFNKQLENNPELKSFLELDFGAEK